MKRNGYTLIELLCVLGTLAICRQGFIEVDGLKREVAEDKQIIAEGRLDDLMH